MRLGIGQKLTDRSEPHPAATIGEKAIMADAMESVGKAVKQETADELVPIKRHESRCVAMTIVAPAECHASLIRVALLRNCFEGFPE